MTYSCSDFTDSIMDALKIDVPEELYDDPSKQADLAMAEIERLQKSDEILKTLQSEASSPLGHIKVAIAFARTARSHLRRANANNAAAYMARALKSAEGAERHARGMESRSSRYRFHMVCPGCGKASETVKDDRSNPRLSCGDCLMDRVEMVEMKVVKVEEAP
jgi:hypothetical protein